MGKLFTKQYSTKGREIEALFTENIKVFTQPYTIWHNDNSLVEV